MCGLVERLSSRSRCSRRSRSRFAVAVAFAVCRCCDDWLWRWRFGVDGWALTFALALVYKSNENMLMHALLRCRGVVWCVGW